jgi:hypothetical protein
LVSSLYAAEITQQEADRVIPARDDVVVLVQYPALGVTLAIEELPATKGRIKH